MLLTVALGIFGVPVAKSLSASGFQDPTSESATATQVLTDKFHQGDVQLLIVVSTPDGVDSAPARAAGNDIVDQLRSSPHVAQVTSPWTAPPPAAADLVSRDRTSGLIVAGINGDENQQQKYAKELSDQVAVDHDGVTVRSGGTAMVNVQITEQSQRDLLVMESLAIPLSFLVLVWAFGGLVAAALPVAVGVMAILGALAVLRLISFATDVSIFALNLTTAMGLALAIDYTLLMISRFRDELAEGASRDDALVRTMMSAGRTVVFSATTVALSMAVMVLFPMHFLKSFAYAGVATVTFAAAAAIVVTPAALVLLGDRLDSLDVRRLARRDARPPRTATGARRAEVLVPLRELRYAQSSPARAGGCRAAVAARRAVPQRALGIPRRSRAAEFGLRSSSRRPVAARLRPQLRRRGDRRRPRHRRRQRIRHRQICRRPVPRARRVRRCPPRRERSSTATGWARRRRPPDRFPAARSSPSTARLRCSPTSRKLSSTACTQYPARQAGTST